MKNKERKEKTKLIENRRNRIIINVLKIKSKELQSRLISVNEIVAAARKTTQTVVAAGNVCYLFAYTHTHVRTHTHDSCDRNVDVDCGARLSTPFPFRKTKWIAL